MVSITLVTARKEILTTLGEGRMCISRPSFASFLEGMRASKLFFLEENTWNTKIHYNRIFFGFLFFCLFFFVAVFFCFFLLFFVFFFFLFLYSVCTPAGRRGPIHGPAREIRRHRHERFPLRSVSRREKNQWGFRNSGNAKKQSLPPGKVEVCA